MRTTAYWQVRTCFRPQKLNASLKVERDNRAARELQQKKNRRAPTAIPCAMRFCSSALMFRVGAVAPRPAAAASSRSIRSSAFTPKPLRPLTSTYGFFSHRRETTHSPSPRAHRGVKATIFIGQMDRNFSAASACPSPRNPWATTSCKLRLFGRRSRFVNLFSAGRAERWSAWDHFRPLVVAQTSSPPGAFWPFRIMKILAQQGPKISKAGTQYPFRRK